MFRLSMSSVSTDAAEAGRRRSIDTTHHAGEEVWTGEGTNTQTFAEENSWEAMCSIASGSSNNDITPTCSSEPEDFDDEGPEEDDSNSDTAASCSSAPEEGEEVWTVEGINAWTCDEDCYPMCTIMSESSNSDTASTCSSDPEDFDAEGPEDFDAEGPEEISPHRRCVRKARDPEEKSLQWKIVRHPIFQHWARKSVFLQEEVKIPENLQHGASLPEREARLPQPKRKPRRSVSAPMKRLLSAEPLVGQRDNDGVLMSCVQLGRRRARVESNMMCSTLSKITVNSEMTVAQGAKDEAVLKMANSFVMKLLVQNLANRTRMRMAAYAADDMETDDQYSRSNVTAEANNFDCIYARVRDILAEWISFVPLRRAHTSCLGEGPFRH